MRLPSISNNDVLYMLVLYDDSTVKTVEEVLNNFIDARWAHNISWKVVDSHLILLQTCEWMLYLWFFNYDGLFFFFYLSRALFTCFIFVKLSFSLPFKFIKICLGCTKLFVRSTTTFFSFSVNLPARRRLSDFGSILWLWIPLRTLKHHLFVYVFI